MTTLDAWNPVNWNALNMFAAASLPGSGAKLHIEHTLQNVIKMYQHVMNILHIFPISKLFISDRRDRTWWEILFQRMQRKLCFSELHGLLCQLPLKPNIQQLWPPLQVTRGTSPEPLNWHSYDTKECPHTDTQTHRHTHTHIQRIRHIKDIKHQNEFHTSSLSCSKVKVFLTSELQAEVVRGSQSGTVTFATCDADCDDEF